VAVLAELAEEEAAWRVAFQAQSVTYESYLQPNSLNHFRRDLENNGSRSLAFLERAERDHGARVGR
jgi:hypothetical protein